MFSRETKYLTLIIIIFVAACIETDIFLPALADMMSFFETSEDKIQRLLSFNFLGICLSGPLYGPLSDVVGRKKPLIVALGLFLFGSILTLPAHNFNVMLTARVLQGLGSGGCFTLGTAILFDAFPKKKALHALSRISAIVPFIMAGAPLLGGYLTNTYGFRSNFVAIAIAVCISFLLCLFFFNETHSKEKRVPLKVKQITRDFKTVMSSTPFWQATIIISLIFAVYLAFLSGISLLFVIELNVANNILPYFQAGLLGAWIFGNVTYKGFLTRWGIARVNQSSVLITASGAAALFIASCFASKNPYLITLSMMICSFGVNWIQNFYFLEGMEVFPHLKGISASVITSMRLLITAAMVALGGFFYNATIYPIMAIVCGGTALMLITISLYEKKHTSLDVEND